MPRKKPFPPEADTEPDVLRARSARPESGPAPKGAAERSESPTLPPPAKSRDAKPPDAAGNHAAPPATDPRANAMANSLSGRALSPARRRASASPGPVVPASTRRRGAATVDEVIADLTNDPRRERDDE